MKKSILKVIMSVMVLVGSMSFAADKVYVGTNAEFEPFEYMKDGKMVGFDIDLINEIGKIIGKDIEMKNIAFDGLLPALQAKKLDIVIAGMTATEERKKNVNFSETYYLSEQKILTNKDTDIKAEKLEDLIGKNVGVVLGYTGDIAVSEIEGIKVQRYNGTGEAVMALKAKKIDAIVLDGEPAKQYAAKNPELKLTDTDAAKEEYAIAFRKEDTKLTEDVNKALAQLKANGKYQELLKKYSLVKE